MKKFINILFCGMISLNILTVDGKKGAVIMHISNIDSIMQTENKMVLLFPKGNGTPIKITDSFEEVKKKLNVK